MHVADGKRDQNCQEKEASCGENFRRAATIAHMHEKQNNENRFDKRDEKRDDIIEQTEIDECDCYRDSGQDHEGPEDQKV